MHTPLSLFPPDDQTIEGIGRALRDGETTCAAVLEHCFHQIDLWEDKVRAWVFIDRAGAMRQARALDEELQADHCRGPIHGIPLGIKDIIHVQGMPTACGFRPWERRVAEGDAEIVATLRAAGGVILGKTVTTPFAWIDPPTTRNPWNLERTPGGSSSGSAAAVATGMCLGAVGTQTGGSVTRPAAFCGVASLKKGHSHARGMGGVNPFAPTLDHLGFFGRIADDVELIDMAISDVNPSSSEVIDQRINNRVFVMESLRSRHPRGRHSTLIRPRGYFDRRVEPEALGAFEKALALLTSAEVEIIEIDDSEWDFDAIVGNHRIIMAAEAAVEHESRLREHPNEYPRHLRALVEEGLAVSTSRYIRARNALERRREAWDQYFPEGASAIITPAAVGPAPDASTTGNPSVNAPWSYLGLPVYSFPIGLSSEGLPLGMQLVGPSSFSNPLEPVALWCSAVFRTGQVS